MTAPRIRRRTWLIASALVAAASVSLSCGSVMNKAPIMQMGKESRMVVTGSLESARDRGEITDSQYRAAMSDLFAESVDWGQLWASVGSAVVAIAGSLLGVYLHRGPPTQVVGLPSSKVW